MRIALNIEYDGTHYYGWQRQNRVPSVQQTIEKALSQVANHPIEVTCAGRTDTGVHALGQIVHFDTTSDRDAKAWVLGVNSHLADDIRVQWAKVVDEKFHARFSALSRRYQYIICNNTVRPAILRHRVAWHYIKLNEEKMSEAVIYLKGQHDFSSFRGNQCQSKTPFRDVQSLSVVRKDSYIIIDIQANSFLHHMVRNIAGVLMAIGEGRHEPLWAKEVLEAKNRSAGSITASPQGLYLFEVTYPNYFNLPEFHPKLMLFDQ